MSESRDVETWSPGGLRRELTLLALVATAVCTVIGGGINVLTIEVQGKIPGIGSMVPLAFALGAVPALFTALAYAVLASAMPRAGGGYIYISRSVHPFIGFIATFSKWFGLAAACGVIAYIDVTLLRAATIYAKMDTVAAFLETGAARLWIPIALIWIFWLVNLVGVRKYGITVIVLMILMLAGGAVIIAAGLLTTPDRWMALAEQSGNWGSVQETIAANPYRQTGVFDLLRAVSVLFFAYIGFATISQAGGETRDPSRILPRAFLLATVVITGYYILFSAAVYHAVPWQWVSGAVVAREMELSVPEVFGVLLPPGLAVFVALMAAVALANDIPPILLAVSRLFFAWAKDGIFPPGLAAVNRRFGTPHWALTVSAAMATLVVIECHFHGFFTGIDTVVIALCFTYLLIGVGVLMFPRRNPELYSKVTFIKSRGAQIAVAVLCLLTIAPLFVLQVYGDLDATSTRIAEMITQGESVGWTLLVALPRSMTVLWLVVMIIGAGIFTTMWAKRRRAGEDLDGIFRSLPEETGDSADAAGPAY
ncbi:MAG: APC family permease [Armatimonadetes bacterium]|nr:APC family permease [Armatimonadota bacterium]